ncbi:MAG TPA: TIGR04282 family arsenosugar biosynthesis glycosyltransferase, partial [Candidatus Eisenbacteria bacterium]
MRRLAVFARSPAPGRVKSRLSPALPERLAAALYAGLLADAFAAASAAAVDERLVYWADESGATPAGFLARRQPNGDLGERLQHAFAELLPGASDRALVIGSDTPPLTAAHIDGALAALETHDAVLGPTRDGGYWCVGLRRPAPELFAGIPWSTPDVFTRTLARAHAAGLGVATAATLDDLDTPGDVACLV